MKKCYDSIVITDQEHRVRDKAEITHHWPSVWRLRFNTLQHM